jgi:transposase
MITWKNFIGVDVSKRTLDICLLNAEGQLVNNCQISNTRKSMKEHFDALQNEFGLDLDCTLVCLEHTGIYSNILLEFLSAIQMPICVEMALRIKRSQGIQRGKNDRIDALRIAEYAYVHHRKLRLWTPTRSEIKQLKALTVLRERLMRIMKQLAVPLKESEDFMDKAIQKELKSACTTTLRSVRKDLKRINQRIDLLIGTDEKLGMQMKLLTSVTGIGREIATQMIIATNEFQTIREPKKFACYSGVAPFEQSSGTSLKVKPRVSKLANMDMKKMLYLGATSAIQYSPEMKQYYERKVTEGKKPMSVINAVGNKLITRAFVCINQNRPYQKIYKHPLA